jgi:hypothetical protein
MTCKSITSASHYNSVDIKISSKRNSITITIVIDPSLLDNIFNFVSPSILRFYFLSKYIFRLDLG